VKDVTGSFTGALPVTAVILMVAMLLPIFTRNPATEGGRWAHLAPRRRVHA
jgi:hypothetical protein